MSRPERLQSASELRNLGPKSEEWLREIGMNTRQDLDRAGSVEVYRLLKERGFAVSLLMVYAVEGALRDIDWRELPPELKAELRAAVKRI